ncbi:MAG TPA: Bax inhibitor-1/YccA family protein [Aeromicrobium sp.]|nr:Bax inhibitor-1/YccA family protein [Aeromicrobium sp.]
MRSSNPVFSRTDGFNGAAPVGFDQHPTHTELGRGTGRMTLETVIEKTAITTGTLVITSVLAFVFIGSQVGETRESLEQAIGIAGMLSLVGALGGFVLAMVNSFKKVVSPALVLAYAAIEGLFVGAFSWFVSVQFAGGQLDLVFGAVLGTLAALGGTLAAYKFFNIQVGNRFRKVVIASMFGFVAVSLLDWVLSFFGHSFGFNGFGPMGLISSVIGVVIAVFMLILDFDFVERGVAAGLPERESWRAAFGLTVTIVWLYIELLRILAILRGND